MAHLSAANLSLCLLVQLYKLKLFSETTLNYTSSSRAVEAPWLSAFILTRRRCGVLYTQTINYFVTSFVKEKISCMFYFIFRLDIFPLRKKASSIFSLLRLFSENMSGPGWGQNLFLTFRLGPTEKKFSQFFQKNIFQRYENYFLKYLNSDWGQRFRLGP